MIKGWSDAVRIPRLGTIALGERDDRGTPRAVDYFVVPPEVQEVYGPQPRELDIVLPSDDLETIFPAYLKRYGEQFGLICRGDGQTATVNELYARSSGMEYGIAHRECQFIDAATGEVLVVEKAGDKGWVRIACPYKNCQHYINKKCREVAVLSVLLPRVPGVLGAYSIDTGSFNSYINIRNSLLILKQMLGRISFIPLKLKVRMQEVHPEVNGRQIKRMVPIMYIDMGDLTLEKVLQLARERKLLTVASLPALTGGIELEPYNEDVKPELLYVEEEADVASEPAEMPKDQPVPPLQEEKPGPAPQQESESEAKAVEQPVVEKPVGVAPEKPVEKHVEEPEKEVESEESIVVTVQSGPKEARTQRGVWVYCPVTLEDGRATEVWAIPGTPAVDGLRAARKGGRLLITIQQVKNGKYAISAAMPVADAGLPDEEINDDDFGFDGLF